MSRRVIDFAREDDFGHIVAIGNRAEDWSPVDRREAIAHIESGEHSYVVLADGRIATIGVVEGRWLRSSHNDQEVDNLDALVWGPPGSAGLTGSFDLMITIGDDAFRRLLAALHAASVIDHEHVLVQDGHQIEVSMGCPRIEEAAAAATGPGVAITTRLQCTASRLDVAMDPGFSAVVDVVSRAGLAIKLTPDHVAHLQVTHAAPDAASVQLLTPLPATQDAIVRRALATWLEHGRPDTWQTPLPEELAFAAHAGCRVVQPGCLQVGLGALGAAPPVYPAPEPGDWTIAISRWQLTRRVYDALRARLGVVPPPAGTQRVLIDAARKIYLQRLSVSLEEGHVVLSGVLKKTSAPTLTASFTTRVTLGLTATGLVRIDDVRTEVAVQEWYAAVADFFSAGSFTTALRQGIRDALAGEGGSDRPLVSAQLLGDVATFGVDRKLLVKPGVTRLSVRPSGLVLGGRLDVQATLGPVGRLHAITGDGGTALLHGAHSWAAGRELVDAHWTFGDDAQLQTSGPGMRLAVVHTYAPGTYTPTLTLTDDRGASASAHARLHVP